MDEQMKKYRDCLETMSEPIMLSQCPPINLKLRELMSYAKENGKKVVELTEEEKNIFIRNYSEPLIESM